MNTILYGVPLVGAAMLGPRIGKYDKNGNPHAIPGHNLTAGALGVFILWFCWFGFNGGSSLSLATDEAMTLTGLVCFNTNLAAAVATCVTMIFTWVRYGKPDVIVSKISVDSVVEAAKKALYTGHIGDGKIFVYNVTRVVKIRTGEEDFAALQDVE